MSQHPVIPLHAPATPAVAPSPIIKWAGGKTRLLEQYEGLFPVEFERYHEPFLGGAAVFFHLAASEATLSDINGRLIECYRVVRDQPEALIERLDHHRERHSKVHYYAARTRFNAPRGLNAVDRAALFIYLNKTCFNGLYRENARGEFNVPMGSYRNPSLYDATNIRAASRVLQGVELENRGFQSTIDHAQEGDLVYFDPPYVPLSTTSSFTTYAKGGFDMGMQIELAKHFDRLARRGCMVMLSNSDCDAVRELYAGWRIERISAPRSISVRGDRRGPVGEVLVRSW